LGALAVFKSAFASNPKGTKCFRLFVSRSLRCVSGEFLLPRKRNGIRFELLTAFQEAIFRISSLSQLSPVSRAASTRFFLSKPLGGIGVKKFDGRGPLKNHPVRMEPLKNVVTLL